MRICRFNGNRIGVVLGSEVADVSAAVQDILETVPAWPLPAGDWLIANLQRLRPAFEALLPTAPRQPIAGVELLSPVANPTKIIAAPINYRAHHDEVNTSAEINFGNHYKSIENVGLFLKANSSLVGPSQGIEQRLRERRHDHEAELVLVIGKAGRDIAEADALDHVAGYCVGLDMTTRGPEERSLRKSMDTYSVLGPWLTTADEVADPDDLEMVLRVNGEVRQQTNTGSMIFGTRRLIAYASSFYTLNVGDILYTGTPEGVGAVLPGDEIVVGIASVGEMTTRILP